MSWVILSLAAAVFIGFSYVCTKQALKIEHAYELHITSLAIVGLLSAPLLIGLRFEYSYLWWVLLGKGIIVALGQYTALRSFRHLELSEAAPLRNLSSVFVLILAIVFLAEKITVVNIGGIIVLVFGTYILERASHKTTSAFDFSFLNNKFVLLALASVSILSISAILDKFLVTEMGFRIVWGAGNLMILSIVLIFYGLQRRTFRHIIPRLQQHKAWIIGGSIAGYIGGLLYIIAVAQPGALIAVIIPVRRLSILFAVIISWRIFHEHNVLHKTGATVIMFVGFVLTIL